MKNKVQRQLAIRQVISRSIVSNQEKLLEMLRDKGYDLTQATLSRDLKALGVAKIPDPQLGYVYRISESRSVENQIETSSVNYLADGFINMQVSGNLAVIKTLPGYASSIAIMIDKAGIWEIMGTIAGDDTILIILREGINRTHLKNALLSVLPKLEEKFI